MRRRAGRWLRYAAAAGPLLWGLEAGAVEPNQPRATTVQIGLYGGAGKLDLARRQADPEAVQDEHAGVGVAAGHKLFGVGESGGFAAMGATLETRRLMNVCERGFRGTPQCPHESHRQTHVGGRAGFEYRWPRLALRSGLLVATPLGSQPRWQIDALVFPDVWLRLGPADRDWVELGLGAYDASTLLRPGAFLGAGIVGGERVLVTLHAGVNAGNGSFGARDVTQLGQRVDVALDMGLSDSVNAGLTAALQAYGDLSVEAAARLLVRL